MINSLSWQHEIAIPTPVDSAKTILRIDLRDVKWNSTTWKRILDAYPYRLVISTPDLQYVQTLSGSAVPFIRADWFVTHASVPPLYHEILELPTTVQELEKELTIDAAQDLVEEKNTARGGVRNSGVSRNNRVLERHSSPYGAYWKSFDFSNNIGDQNIFQDPIRLSPAGGEFIFNLPNGMQAYFLAKGNGTRLNQGPREIVSDRNHPDTPDVINGRSCMSCHFAGMKEFNDEVRPMLVSVQQAPFDLSKALALYPGQDRLGVLIRTDTDRFQRAVRAAGGTVSKDFRTEPINALSQKYAADLDVALTAAEVGLRETDLINLVQSSASLQRLSLGQLLTPNGGVKRDLWEQIYSNVALEVAQLPASSQSHQTLAERLPERPVPVSPASPAPVPADASYEPRALKMLDIEQKSGCDLDYLRNEAYARHGLIFAREDLKNHFQQFPWYHPKYLLPAFPLDVLSPTEKANIDLIKKYQNQSGKVGTHCQ